MRFEKLTSCINLQNGMGLEIGPLASPVITRDMGNIFYVDHASTAEIQTKYKDNPTVIKENIVEVDYVWGEKTLVEATGKAGQYDYVLASHVIEHVPDLIGWLNEIHAVLKTGGILTLAIPDKRLTFDLHRNVTILADVVDAHLRGVRRPTARQVFEHHSAAVHKNGALAWNARAEGEPAPIHGLNYALKMARLAETGGQYVDVHCWVFTPASLFGLLAQMTWMGFVSFGPRTHHATTETDHEFFLALESLEPTDDPKERLTRARRFAELAGADVDLRDWRALEVPLSFSEPQPEPVVDPRAVARVLALETAVRDLQQGLAAMHASTSWRMTAPLRKAVEFVRGVKPH